MIARCECVGERASNLDCAVSSARVRVRASGSNSLSRPWSVARGLRAVQRSAARPCAFARAGSREGHHSESSMAEDTLTSPTRVSLVRRVIVQAFISIALVGLAAARADAQYRRRVRRHAAAGCAPHIPLRQLGGESRYVVEVSLVSTAPGAHVTSSVQPELEGAAWNDVVRVQLLNASGLVSANGSHGDQAERADPPDPPGRKCHEHHDGY